MIEEMAAAWFGDNLCCPVCYNTLRDPVVLSCSHSACKACLQNVWANSDSQGCPLCGRRSSEHDSPSNLSNLCDSAIQRCCQHNEHLTLFCLEDQQPVCVVCQASDEHKNHDCRPIQETADSFKRELETTLEPLQEKLCSFTQAKETCHKTQKHIKRQAQKTEEEIRQAFEKLHQFLRNEEAARLAALKEEEERKSQMMKKKIDKISSAISFLLKTIDATEQDLGAEDIAFLQNFNSSMKRAECSLKVPQMDSGMLIDVAKHLGNLTFRVWEKMQEIVQYTPVILDPNTAHPHLTLSDDLTSVTFTNEERPDMQQVPDNPERFDRCVCVLGSEGFSSGSHWWDVEVGDSYLWQIGITTESNQRRGVLFFNGVWSVESNMEFYTYSPAQLKLPFSAEGGLPRIRVQLDWDKGEVSFFDLLNDAGIVSFTHTFTEKVYPFFWTRRSNSPVKILPVTLGVVMPCHELSPELLLAAGPVDVLQVWKFAAYDGLRCPHHSLQGLAVVGSTAAVPDSDAGREDALYGASVEVDIVLHSVRDSSQPGSSDFSLFGLFCWLVLLTVSVCYLHTMASKRSFSEEDFTCPVCCDIFKEPVLLSCGHSVCRVCVRRYWRTKGSQECPLCRKRSFRTPPLNLALRNLSQTFLEVRGDPETLCDIHGEKLKLYCVDEAQPVCVVCRDSRTHQGHTFRPVEEVAVEMKEVLKGARKTVIAKWKKLDDVQINCQQKIDHIENFKQTLEKAQCTQMSPEEAGELISVAKYLGNLQFRVWKKMQDIIKYSFSFGVHSWDVEVGNNTFWMVGVTTESVHRKEHTVFPRRAWGVGYDNEQLCARTPQSPYTRLPVVAKPQVVCGGGALPVGMRYLESSDYRSAGRQRCQRFLSMTGQTEIQLSSIVIQQK
ncbi:hypothetical protein NFI96_022464, partial [Prochilodus magdalenae]